MNILELERRHASGVHAKRDVNLVRGDGVRVLDDTGRVYLDLAAGHGVAALGHCHPEVTAAIAAQAATLVTCPETHPTERRAEYVARLAALLPGAKAASAPWRVFLCNSGTEAVEGALKFARLSTGRTGVVAAMRGFHGRTMGALSATWERRYREPFAPLVPGFTHVPFDRLAAMEEAVGEDTACVLVEIVQGEGGVRPGSTEYFTGLRRLCDERGALLVVDEVQTGFGRTGRMFACAHHGVVPDLLCLGKAIGGGVPMGATAIGPRVGELGVGTHGSTFGGNPLACAAAGAVLDVLARDGLAARAARLGEWLLDRLRRIDSPRIRKVRGQGLLVGIELRERVTPHLCALLDEGILALPAGPTVLRLLPPLVISEADLAAAADGIEHVLTREV